eukprot:g55983.t1
MKSVGKQKQRDGEDNEEDAIGAEDEAEETGWPSEGGRRQGDIPPNNEDDEVAPFPEGGEEGGEEGTSKVKTEADGLWPPTQTLIGRFKRLTDSIQKRSERMALQQTRAGPNNVAVAATSVQKVAAPEVGRGSRAMSSVQRLPPPPPEEEEEEETDEEDDSGPAPMPYQS